MHRPRILFLDAYDSFSNNVVSLLTTLLQADVDIVPIDSPDLIPTASTFHADLVRKLAAYDAVVCGPGPGSPVLDADVGLMKYIWSLDDEHLLPVLGICLGFQSLAASCGALIERLPGGGLHGMIRHVDFRTESCEGNIFSCAQPFKATLYHSLHADIGQASIPESEWPVTKWGIQSHLSTIVPLAWVEDRRADTSLRILMGLRHNSKPFWGLQYHPESICSEVSGHQIILNWFQEATKWNELRARSRLPCLDNLAFTRPMRASLLAQANSCEVGDIASRGTHSFSQRIQSIFRSKTVKLPGHVSVPDIVEILQSDRREHIILDSASAHTSRIGLDVRGRYSILALDIEDSLRFEYHVGHSHVNVRLPRDFTQSEQQVEEIKLGSQQNVWHVLADWMDKRKLMIRTHDTPFIGGFMGYVTYELGLEYIDVDIAGARSHHRPDLCFAWVTKSIVIDHLEGTLHIQCLHDSANDAERWTCAIASMLQTAPIWTDGLRLNNTKLGGAHHLSPPATPTMTASLVSVTPPNADEYESKVRQCQDYIASGDSYELCLTDQTAITRTQASSESQPSALPTYNSWAPSSASKIPSSWQLYRTLRARQPAPFGSYLRLGTATLISSSPERFLEYDAEGRCSMRPMKGTVKKSDVVSTLSQAEEILHVPKEEAENLMIVDLVRHDLHSVCGPGNVSVPQLMMVEEYASVFQMISVVAGQLPRPPPAAAEGGGDGGGARDDSSPLPYYTGLDVLAASLPPGSMTGAPKKRSCEILQEIEGGRERSLYSGVVGYMDVTGRGDWSVTIRSLFKWDDETTRHADGTETETWHIGAGGAVTALSTPEGEREEMFTKLKGPLGIFEDRS